MISTGIRYKNGRWEVDKDPDAELDYGFDLVDWLADGDSVASVAVDATGVTATNARASGTEILAHVTGGTVDEPAQVRYRFTTAGGDVDDRTLHFIIEER